MEIMKQLEQFEGIEHWCKAFHGLIENKRVMETDLWLRVEGASNVYALGDCATIYQCISPKQYQYTILSEVVTKMKGLLPNVQVATQHETLDKINQVAGFQLGSAGRFSWREFDQFDPNCVCLLGCLWGLYLGLLLWRVALYDDVANKLKLPRLYSFQLFVWENNLEAQKYGSKKKKRKMISTNE
ncbi:hypothetical protein Tco_1440633 [Tanacetum coccineum]